MTRYLFAVLSLGAVTLAACDSPDKKPPTVTLERSQIVEAKPGDATTATAPAAPVVPAVSSSKPKSAPRLLCAGQMSSPGRAAPKKPVSQNVASGEAALPEALPLGSGYTWVNFWAAWCAPCKEEIPRLIGFQQELVKSSPSFRLAFVSLDDDERQLSGFLASQPPSGLRRSYWLKEGKERDEWLKAAGVDSDPDLPFHLLFDPKGKLRCIVKGALEDADLTTLKSLVSP